MNIIVAVDKKWGIGNKGKLLVSIPRDKKLFREETTGKVIHCYHFPAHSHLQEERI